MEYSDVQEILESEILLQFAQDNFRDSMSSIGFSEDLICEFVENIQELSIDKFIENNQKELQQIELYHYGDTLIPKFLTKYVLPYISRKGTFLDLGCGRGTLISLVKEQNHCQMAVGVDILSSPEWDSIKNDQVKFIVASGTDFINILKDEQPMCVAATMMLHHLEYQAQTKYFKTMHAVLPRGATVLLLEDSYSTKLYPETGLKRHNVFMKLSPQDRLKIMGVYDWFANRVFCMRTNTPVTFAYRTIEEWEETGKQAGFTHLVSRFIGFPEQFDVNTPRAFILLQKK